MPITQTRLLTVLDAGLAYAEFTDALLLNFKRLAKTFETENYTPLQMIEILKSFYYESMPPGEMRARLEREAAHFDRATMRKNELNRLAQQKIREAKKTGPLPAGAYTEYVERFGSPHDRVTRAKLALEQDAVFSAGASARRAQPPISPGNAATLPSNLQPDTKGRLVPTVDTLLDTSQMPTPDDLL